MRTGGTNRTRRAGRTAVAAVSALAGVADLAIGFTAVKTVADIVIACSVTLAAATVADAVVEKVFSIHYNHLIIKCVIYTMRSV